jgi:hypothetical protein
MSGGLAALYGDELAVLSADRRAHSLVVGRKAAVAAHRVPPALRADLVTAAVLHDVGYGHGDTGLHALDGARYLADGGYSRIVCNLVAHHSASTLEAEERGINLAVFRAFRVEQDLGAAHAVLWWADMTTGPRGESVPVEQRLIEIGDRYGPEDVVTRFVARARDILVLAGQSPTGSIQVPC